MTLSMLTAAERFAFDHAPVKLGEHAHVFRDHMARENARGEAAHGLPPAPVDAGDCQPPEQT